MESVTFSLDTGFLVKGILSFTSNFTQRKQRFLSTEWYQGCWVLVDELPTLGLLESVAVLGLSTVLTDAYNTGTLQFYYHPIDIHFVLFHVKFENGLSISWGENQGNSRKFYNWKSKSFYQSQIFLNAARPLYFKLLCGAIGQDLEYRCMSEFPKWPEYVQKSKVMMISSRFYCQWDLG
jgi:hypothetical protein